MHRSKLSSWVVARPVVLVLTVGVLLVGLSACGSSSSTKSKRSSSSVVKKEAGTMHVDLTAINQTGGTIGGINLCDPSGGPSGKGGCEFFGDPLHGASDGQSGSVQVNSTAYGGFDYPDGSKVYFEAGNPTIGLPYIRVSSDLNGDENSSGDVGLVEGEVQTRTVNGHVIDLERRGDTDYKELRVIAKS